MTSNEPQSREWYQKKRYTLPIGLIAVVSLLSATGDSVPANSQSASVNQAVSAPVQNTAQESSLRGTQPVTPITSPTPSRETAPSYNPAPTPTPPPVVTAPSQAPAPAPTTDRYYTNVDGDQIQSPTYAPSRPAGATARCNNGTYSFSQNRRGTCSHHGGVAVWY